MVLTDIAIRNAKPAEKPLRLYDRDGLYLEISPAGGKWWRLKYHFAGKEKRISLGVHPEVDLKKARQRTLEARQLIAERVDPSEHKKAAQRAAKQQDAYRFEAVAREWITRMARPAGRRGMRRESLLDLNAMSSPGLGHSRSPASVHLTYSRS